jgi:hypothetical protein
MTVGFPEPVFGHHRLPTGKRLLLAGEATPARCSIAIAPPCAALPPKKPDLPFVLLRRCAVRFSYGGCPRVARACGADGPPADRASFSIISTRQKLMPRSNRLDQRGNAETYRNAPPYSRFDLCSRRIRGRWISLFMALHSSRGQSNPGLHAQGEQRRSSYCNNDRDIALSQSETFQSFKFCNKLLQFVCCRNQAFRIQSL